MDCHLRSLLSGLPRRRRYHATNKLSTMGRFIGNKELKDCPLAHHSAFTLLRTVNAPTVTVF